MQKVYPRPRHQQLSHQQGTTHMGNDMEALLLDRDCRTHAVENLFVVDGGPFPRDRREPDADDHGPRLADG